MSRPRIMAWFWSLMVLGLHSIPRARLLELPGGEKFISTTGSDKAAHVVLFGVFAFLWSRCFGNRLLMVVAAGLVYGGALEIYQEWLIPGRSGSMADLAADALGLVIGAGGFAWWGRRKAGGR